MQLKLAVLILGALIILPIYFQNVSAHYVDESNIKTLEDVVDYCDFFNEEFNFMTERDFFMQHTYQPKLRYCIILYDHLIWPTAHPDRAKILALELEKLLGDSEYIKQRHISDFNLTATPIPLWIKEDASKWSRSETSDSRFAYLIRTMINLDIVKPSLDDPILTRNCEYVICVEESDYVKYSIVDSQTDEIIIEKYTVKEISNNIVTVGLEITSQQNIDYFEFDVDLDGNTYDVIKTQERDSSLCQLGSRIVFVNGIPECQDTDSGRKTQPKTTYTQHKVFYPIPLEVGSTVFGPDIDLTLSAEVVVNFGDLERVALIAQDSTGKYYEVVDKKTGLVLLSKFEEGAIFPVWKKTELLDSNMLVKKFEIELDINIPGWWKKNTQWVIDGLISEGEYLRAMEYLIGQQVIRV
ncbi:MAG: hypothetical protein NPMRTH4_610002 [Nitrosopumilales archaeon]|nr:MAG: hypothetical protein NPMRTH4_610002 [Nitrosopumilales archaeon]